MIEWPKCDSFNDFWKLSVPTYIENWPKGLRELSVNSIDIPLSLDDAKIIGSNIMELGERFAPRALECSEIKSVLDQAMARFYPKGAFVRLGSRSPKDSWAGNRNGFKVKTGAEAFGLLTDCSERIADDLQNCIAQNYPPHIFVREWVDIENWREFRCFMLDRKLIGISQYYYREYFPQIGEYETVFMSWINGWFTKKFLPAIHVDSVVFDIWVNPTKMDEVITLIEINPLIATPMLGTDPCLFDYSRPDEFDGRMKYRLEVTAEKEGNFII
jgi:hypothetical protein